MRGISRLASDGIDVLVHTYMRQPAYTSREAAGLHTATVSTYDSGRESTVRTYTKPRPPPGAERQNGRTVKLTPRRRFLHVLSSESRDILI